MTVRIGGATFFLVLALLTTAARADEASDYLAAAGDEVDAFGRCTVNKAWPLISSQMAADEIAARAVADCQDLIPPIKKGLMGAPTNLSGDAADKVVSEVVAGNKSNVIDIVDQQRKRAQ
jgi:hypothetical protein